MTAIILWYLMWVAFGLAAAINEAEGGRNPFAAIFFIFGIAVFGHWLFLVAT